MISRPFLRNQKRKKHKYNQIYPYGRNKEEDQQDLAHVCSLVKLARMSTLLSLITWQYALLYHLLPTWILSSILELEAQGELEKLRTTKGKHSIAQANCFLGKRNNEP